MTEIAGTRDVVLFCLCRGNEPKCVAVNIYVRNCLRDLGHMAGNAIAARTCGRVMGVFRKTARVWPVRRSGTVTFKTDNTGWL